MDAFTIAAIAIAAVLIITIVVIGGWLGGRKRRK